MYYYFCKFIIVFKKVEIVFMVCFFWLLFKCVEYEIIEENFLKYNYFLKYLGMFFSEIIFNFCNFLNSYNCIFLFLLMMDFIFIFY